jgi:hypothetical protein
MPDAYLIEKGENLKMDLYFTKAKYRKNIIWR